MSVEQPAWTIPARKVEEPVLKVYNSLTRTKVHPTMQFISIVFLRSIRQNSYPQMVVMSNGITVDLLSMMLHIWDMPAWTSYVQSKVVVGLPETETPVTGKEAESWPALVAHFQDKAWKQECLKRDEKFEMHFSAANKAFIATQEGTFKLKNNDASQDVAQRLVDECKDIFALSLDKKEGSTVTDHSIFRSLSAYWEDQFFRDMRRLRVRDPDTLTRVTEYVPEIVSFVEGIIKNGYGYAVDGSVYFDTQAFDNADGHDYAKLAPWSKGNRELLAEGEGALSAATGRRSGADFALWKASKPGEPSWPSPWGQGRPGWHIECSVMASAILGDNMDIHSGGVDLAFPHHDNEMAQSEAFHGCPAWVNYFLHTGHLHIEGLKMSKSLKNFITIDEILQKYSARQLRLAFLTQLWNAKVDFSESLMTGEVRNLEITLNNFFTVVKALVSQAQAEGPRKEGSHRFGNAESELTVRFHESQTAFRAALCDSFNTPGALDVLRDLVSRTNVYISSLGADMEVSVVERIAVWIGQMLRMFGLGEGKSSEIGWGQEVSEGGDVNREEVLMPYLRALSSFRDGVRKVAIAKGDHALKDILALCDKLRDDDLVSLGVALDDQDDGKALVKLVPPADLMKARDEKRAQAGAKAANKAAKLEAEREKKMQKLNKGRTPPQEMFKPPNVPEGTYSSWNDDGLPLTGPEGQELSKNQTKKAQKAWGDQQKAHEEFLAWQREE
ncbi:hypothetical protein PHLCEN_2v13140 [Hermanssonia centrifuga]|uniref:cysteine--tRNA ligase n=1 Tax=Hermanssonia centrifuga TaxID=98765 RepID=A0A2R6NEZ9_9APHY|nr:hypothetical protein PHLCEN_2v13140 [Hermanssonia centrifuga]